MLDSPRLCSPSVAFLAACLGVATAWSVTAGPGMSFRQEAQLGPAAVEGLWSYTTIAPGGRSEAPLTGLFLFHKGRFVQQAVNEGEPFEQQIGQAHIGFYKASPAGVDLVAELAIAVAPSRRPALSLRRKTEHTLSIGRESQDLTLTFGSGTVQKFRRVGPGEGTVIDLEEGNLALVDGHFLLVAVRDDRVVAGSGTYERSEDTLTLKVMTWFSVEGGEATYVRDQVIEARFDGHVLQLPDGSRFRVRESRSSRGQGLRPASTGR